MDDKVAFPWLLILISIKASFSLVIVEGPKNVAVTVGNDVLLTCKVNETAGQQDVIEWSEFISESTGKRIWILNADGSIDNTTKPEKYSIKNKYDLFIKNVSLEDGGNYGCHTILQNSDYFFGQVNVFGQSLCTANRSDLLEGERAHFECHAAYSSQQTPTVIFTKDGAKVTKDVIEKVEDKVVYVYVNFTAFDVDDDYAYACETTFHDPPYNDSSACSLNVTYSPRNITFTPESEMFVIGNKIKCDAIGNPQPYTTWVQAYPDTTVVNSSVLQITSDLLGLQVWICQAQNVVDGNVTFTMRNITFTVYESTTPGVNSGAGVWICSWLLLVMIVGQIYFI